MLHHIRWSCKLLHFSLQPRCNLLLQVAPSINSSHTQWPRSSNPLPVALSSSSSSKLPHFSPQPRCSQVAQQQQMQLDAPHAVARSSPAALSNSSSSLQPRSRGSSHPTPCSSISNPQHRTNAAVADALLREKAAGPSEDFDAQLKAMGWGVPKTCRPDGGNTAAQAHQQQKPLAMAQEPP